MFALIKTKKSSPNLAAIGLHAEGVCVVRVAREPGRPPRVTAGIGQPHGSQQPLDKVLSALAREYGLNRTRCTTVLNEGDYKLLLMDAPDVPAEELKSAVRWRIKDLIDFHINDATLDVFDVPGEKRSATREMCVVAARNQAIQERVDLLTRSGIDLDIIDIAELAQRNIAALLPQDAAGVALLSLRPRGGLMTLTRQGALYLSRPLTIGLDILDQPTDAGGYDSLLLEVQRSLDYFESHFREAPIRHVVLAPMPTSSASLLAYLASNLNTEVSQLDLTQVLDCDGDLPMAWQASFLTTIGAALRQEVRAP